MKRLFSEHLIRSVTDLCGPWTFRTDPEELGEQQQWHRSLPGGKTVIVPSVWNTELGLLNFEGCGWYEKRFFTPGGTLRFEFGSVMTAADVWLDGERIGSHYGGFSQFALIVPGVKPGTHTLTVRADSRVDSKSIPQRICDWFNYGGIAREVAVEVLEGVVILSQHLCYTLDGSRARVSARLELLNADSRERTAPLSVTVGDLTVFEGNVTLSAGEKRLFETPEVTLSNVALWSPEEPRLYTVTAKTDTDDLIDRVGFRTIEVKDNEILLNGKKLSFRGVNRHEEHPDWGFAFPPALMKKDLDLLRELGCNTVRGSHYPQSRIFVDMLDEAGLLFWSEIPIWGVGFSEEALSDPDIVARGLEMHREMTHWYYNHPSIIIWGMHNEINTNFPCTHEMSRLYSAFLRQHGGNRLITHAASHPFADTGMEFDDIVCINLYHGWYGGDFTGWDRFVEDFRAHREAKGLADKPVIMSEFGAGALAGFHSHFDSVRWSEEYQAELLAYCLELFHRTDYMRGFYLWQFCNIRTSPLLDLNRVRCFNNKGILDEHRNPKAAFFKVRELYRRFAAEE